MPASRPKTRPAIAGLIALSTGALSPGASADPLFPAPLLELGDPGQSIVVADFNGDGLDDVAVALTANLNSPTPVFPDDVAVFLGRGKGEFSQGTRYKVAPGPWQIRIGDFNGDRRPDLAVLSYQLGVSVLINAGEGTFLPEVRLGGGTEPILSNAIADFDADGRSDIVTLNYGVGYEDLSIYSGRADGTFAVTRRFSAGTELFSVGAGDFDADGRAEILVTRQTPYPQVDEGVVLKQQADGSFEPAASFFAPKYPLLVLTADLNSDGADDVVMVGTYSEFIFVSRPGETLSFDLTLSTSSVYATSFVTGDLNGDGHLDLVYSWMTSSFGSTSLRLGNGEGTFGPEVGLGSGGSSVAVGDFDPDGHLDLAAVSDRFDAVTILPGNGDGTFGPKARPVGDIPRALVRGDFNADGALDLAIANAGSDDISVLLGRGDGTFGEERRFAAGRGPVSMVVGDFDRDGRLDIAVANSGSEDVSILRGIGDGTFSSGAQVPLALDRDPQGYALLAAGDFTGDGATDLVVAVETATYDPYHYGPPSSELRTLIGGGDGTFTARRAGGVLGGALSVAAGDFNQDGLDDIAVSGSCGDPFYCPNRVKYGLTQILLGMRDGTFGYPVAQIEVGSDYPTSATTADLDADGHLDLAIGGSILTVLYGDGNGQFTRQIRYDDVGGDPLVADFNADGIKDLAAGAYAVLLGREDGSFSPRLRFLGAGGRWHAAGDFNNDGRQDIVALQEGTSRPSAGAIAVILNQGPFPVRPVSIDVKPNTFPNVVNASAHGVLPVALLGTSDFDAAAMDPASVTLGSLDSASSGGESALFCHPEDVNGDGRTDLLCQFRIANLALQPGSTTLVLKARTFNGRSLRGEDSVQVIGRLRGALLAARR